ncbi:alpha-latrocrustotoxin-Lt1a-like isoform X1 [Microplitis mediator]|uniref:alpha-latrocrustotoxin-Lt1a-like isoform X1 n=1 Tax=Microplitis mediator TaxID=375433 RepID=UPI002552D8F8|nr:alpha-latrocrustotoxin-Lt1a-like isoform X1 [Microplitis mediator]
MEKKIDVNSILRKAILAEDIEKVDEIVSQYGLSYHDEWDDGYELVRISLLKHKFQVASFLIRAGAKIFNSEKVYPHETPFRLAVGTPGTVDIIKMMLERDRNILKPGSVYEMNANIESIIDTDDPDVVKLAVDHGFEVNPSRVIKNVPLMRSIEKKKLKAMKVLLDSGADINYTRERDGLQPIHMAVDTEKEIIAELLKYGADINAKIKNGCTPLLLSIFHIKSPEIIEFLLENNADVNIAADGDYTPLGTAFLQSKKQISETVKVLIKHIIKIKSQNLYVSDANFSLLKNNDMKNYAKKCEDEIEQLKIQKIINTNIPFYDILAGDAKVLIRYARNKNLCQAVESDELKRFPIYGSIMDRRFQKALTSNLLLEKSVNLFQKYSVTGVLSKLPINIIYDIFEYLNDHDLENFIKIVE